MDSAFETERDIRPLPCLDKIAARDGERRTGFFLVTGVGDDDGHVVQQAGLLKGSQGVDDHDISRLHVVDAGATRRIAVALECRERVIGFEYGIEMPDQQNPRTARALEATEQMACPVNFGWHLDPLCLHADRIELAPHDSADLAYALVIHRAAADIHRFFEQRDRLLHVRIDPGRHLCLVFIEHRLGEGQHRK